MGFREFNNELVATLVYKANGWWFKPTLPYKSLENETFEYMHLKDENLMKEEKIKLKKIFRKQFEGE